MATSAHGITQGEMSRTSPESSCGPWPEFFWRVPGLLLPAEGPLLQLLAVWAGGPRRPRKGSSPCCPWICREELCPSVPPGQQRPNTARGWARARLRGCPQLLGQGLLSTSTWRCCSLDRAHGHPKNTPRNSWNAWECQHVWSAEELRQQFLVPPPGAPTHPPVRSFKEFRQMTTGDSCKFKGRKRRPTSKGERLQKTSLQLIIISSSPVRRTQTHSHSGLAVPCSESSADTCRGKASI
ncbi:uncharacterized protein LOC134547494 isoform X2 [Prinia subflava]